MMPTEVRAQLSVQDSPIQRNLSTFARKRVRYAQDFWNTRHNEWRSSEQLYRAWRPADESDVKTREQSLTLGVQKIVVPNTFAQIQSILAWMLNVFLQRKPIIPVEGVGGDDVTAAILHESLLEYQFDNMEPVGELVMLQWFLDSQIYGVGVVKNAFTVREFPQLRVVGGEVQEVDVTSYEGNETLNVAPFDWFPDPRRPMAQFQKGEFCSHRMRRSWTEMLQKQAEGLYTGVQFVPKKETMNNDEGGSGTAPRGGRSDLARTIDMPEYKTGVIDEWDQPYVDLHEMWAYIADPEAMGLPNTAQSGTPRMWVITLANMSRVVRAEPANLPSMRFPFECIEMNYNMHSPSNPGIVEVIHDLVNHQSWLFNARMKSVRKTLNNETLIDPSMVEEIDLAQPNESGFIRLNKSAFMSGVPLSEVAKPFPVSDVTQGHMQDAQVVQDIIERVTGANNLIQGLSNSGRRSATETQGQLSLASGRMNVFAFIATLQGLRHWSRQMTLNNQTFLSSEIPLRLKKPYADVLGQDAIVLYPELLQGQFRFPFMQGGMPTDRIFETNIWREIFGMGLQSGIANPTLNMVNYGEVFARLLTSMQVKNVDDFFLPGRFPAAMQEAAQQMAQQQQQVLPDEEVARQAEAGNLVPDDGTPLPPAAATPGVGANGQGGASGFTGAPNFG